MRKEEYGLYINDLSQTICIAAGAFIGGFLGSFISGIIIYVTHLL